MPALDLLHGPVKIALNKDGWAVTADPYTIAYEEVRLLADLAAERPIAVERAGRKIVVEIKSFLNPSPLQDFKVALGQYMLYRGFLELTAPDRPLYLAISSEIYDSFFEQKAIQYVAQRYQVALLVVNSETAEVEQWIN
jgi:hypothetical protein